MKSYYFECTVSFAYFVPGEDTYYSEEYYKGIVEAKNRKQGKAAAKTRGLSRFKRDFGAIPALTDVKLTLETFYETIDGARAD